MIDRALFDNTINALGMAMNFRMMNQDLISSNIANANTPGYQAKTMSFEDQLKAALNLDGSNAIQASDPRHFITQNGGMRDVRGNIFIDPQIDIRNDLNTVDIDNEMGKLTDNQFLYDATSQMINKKLALLKYAVNEGGF